MYYQQLYKSNHIIIIGDFNVDQKLNTSYSGTKGLVELNKLLNNYKINSYYHYLTKEEFGQESKPTYYHHRKRDMPFHIDYCFISEGISNKETKFVIGDADEWVGWSDHLPLILETKNIVR